VSRTPASGCATAQPFRRVAFAAITEAGRNKLTEASEVHAANLREVFAGFSARELSQLDRLLDRLRGAPLPS
jgi:DNA-binding MarR family transcriptional regulator